MSRLSSIKDRYRDASKALLEFKPVRKTLVTLAALGIGLPIFFGGVPKGNLEGAHGSWSTAQAFAAEPVVVSAPPIRLTWNDPNNPNYILGYKLYINNVTSMVPDRVLDIGLQNPYTATELQEGQTYELAVTAYTINLSESGSSNVLTVRVKDVTSPTPPSFLIAFVKSSSEIDVTCLNRSTDNVGVVGYKVERCQGAGCTNFTEIGSTSTNIYQDIGLPANTLQRYRFRGVDAEGNESMPSTATSNQTPPPPPDLNAPTTPTFLIAGVLSSSGIKVSWKASTDDKGVTGYKIQRCQGVGCTHYAQIGTANGTIYYDIGLPPGTLFRYRVSAGDGTNWSPYSSAASNITLTAANAPAATQILAAHLPRQDHEKKTWPHQPKRPPALHNYAAERKHRNYTARC